MNTDLHHTMIVYQGKDVALPLEEYPQILNDAPLQDSRYIHLREITFQEKGQKKRWEIIKSHNSVSILLYDRQKDGFIFVRQFRISVFLKNPKHGYMYELCAGLCDKNKSLETIVIEEIEEECGYHVTSDRLIKIQQFYSNVGMNGAYQNLFYAEVTQDDKKSKGGGNEAEQEHIELVFVPRNLIHEFLDDTNCPKTISLAYSILWWQQHYKS